MSTNSGFPRSAKDEIDGLPHFLRMCDKVRMSAAGKLDEDYHPNLGKGLDLWLCQLLQIEYSALVDFIKSSGADDRAALDWAYSNGEKPESPLKDWWCSYARNFGFRDALSDTLKARKQDAGFEDRDDICSFFDLIDAEEGR